jgi:hypothetical protein
VPQQRVVPYSLQWELSMATFMTGSHWRSAAVNARLDHLLLDELEIPDGHAELHARGGPFGHVRQGPGEKPHGGGAETEPAVVEDGHGDLESLTEVKRTGAVELTERPILGMSGPTETPLHARSTMNIPMEPGFSGWSWAKTLKAPA